MRRVGLAYLPLHHGKAPYWLMKRMKKLAQAIIDIIVEEYSQNEFLRRLSDPAWFQAFGCVLGFDWHSSGLTTTVCAAIKKAVKPQKLGIAVAGGKGRFSIKTPHEIEKLGEDIGLSFRKIERLKYASKMSAKVDNTAIQAGYPLYHHTFFFSEKGEFAVIQQGMNVQDRTARRYHWLSEKIKTFEEEPHAAICCDVKKKNVLNMVAKDSREARRVCVDLVKEGVKRIRNDLSMLRPIYQRSIQEFLKPIEKEKFTVKILTLPKNVNWKALEEAYQLQPKNFEDLLSIKGIGPATIRSLALISEIIYGEPVSWKDPKKYSFCLGGKDGVPYPVNRRHYDEVIRTLREFVEGAEIERKEKLKALRRLSNFENLTTEALSSQPK